MKRTAAVLLAVSVFSACSGTKKPDRVTRDLLSLPKETLFEKGKTLLARKKYEDGRKYLNFVFESYPNDPLGQKALLLVADSFFSRGRAIGYVEARYRYRDYLSRYPSAPDRDFAFFRFAVCYDKERAAPDRDQANTREALTQYTSLIKEYPDSLYTVQAKARIGALADNLAEHEFGIGYFYFRKGDPAAALSRFLYCEQHYADFNSKDKLFYFIGKSLGRLGRTGEADRYFARLDAEFPKSRWAQEARKGAKIPVDKAAVSG